MLIDVAILRDINVIKKHAEIIPKYKALPVEIQCMWDVKTNVIPLKIGQMEQFQNVQKIPEQRTGKERNQRIAETSHTGHCTRTHTHTSERTNIKT
jgi:hypothetical protein